MYVGFSYLMNEIFRFCKYISIRDLKFYFHSLAPSAAPVDVSGTVVNSTSGFFTFQSPPIDQLNGVLTGFTITCTPSHSSLPTVTSTISITTGGSLTVTDLQPGAVYTCSVAANNSHGSGPPANVFILTPEECE